MIAVAAILSGIFLVLSLWLALYAFNAMRGHPARPAQKLPAPTPAAVPASP